MKILAVSRSVPTPTWGGGIRAFYLLKALAERHTVTLLVPDERGGPPASAAPGEVPATAVVRFPPPATPPKRLHQLLTVLRAKPYALVGQGVPGLRVAVQELLARETYDAVLFDSMFTADVTAGPDVRPATAVIINQHNIEHELLARAAEREQAPLRRWFYRRESQLLRPVELDRCRLADLVLVASDREQDVLSRLVPETTIAVVPNGVDTLMFHGAPADGEVPDRIVFTGSMDYHPNVQGVLFFAEHCWPLLRARVPHASWQIVGRNPPPAVQRLAGLPGVEVLGTVPDVRPHLSAAQVAIVPLLTGSGTRLKILEALAAQKAVVTTSIGCEGLAVRSGEHLLVEDEPEAFVEALSTLLRDAGKRRRLGAAGRALVEADYSWERCGAALLAAVEQLHDRRQAHVPATSAQVAPHGG